MSRDIKNESLKVNDQKLEGAELSKVLKIEFDVDIKRSRVIVKMFRNGFVRESTLSPTFAGRRRNNAQTILTII